MAVPLCSTRAQSLRARPGAFGRGCRRHHAPRVVAVRAEADEDEAAFEERLAKLKTAKRPQSSPSTSDGESLSAQNRAARKKIDYGDETLWREFKPAQADLVFNIAMAATLVWIPLTAAAVGRCSFVKYRITDKRLTVITDAPWKKEESQVGFNEVSTVTGVNRGFGLWGDMVLSLSNGDKLELRSVPKWQEVRDYIMDRRNTYRGKNLTAEELLNG